MLATPQFFKLLCQGPEIRDIRLASQGSDFSEEEAGKYSPPTAADKYLPPISNPYPGRGCRRESP
jgi:hypothetical protein